jgi:hypothetical protein
MGKRKSQIAEGFEIDGSISDVEETPVDTPAILEEVEKPAKKTVMVYSDAVHENKRVFGVKFEDGLAWTTPKKALVLVKNWGFKCPELEQQDGGK